MELNVCPICGSNYDYDDAKKRYYCRYCGHLKPKERPSEEETLLSFASQRLRLADFDGANEAYEDIVHRFPDSSEAFWGLALSSYGIKYEDDYDGKKIPSCYSTSYESLLESPHYKKALSLADDELRKWYEDQAKLIEKVRKEWVGKAEKEAPYDVFLSFKDTEDGKRTSDSYDAHEIYNQLTGLGYRVFFSRVSLQGKTGENYEPYIFAALNSAPCMLLFSSKPEYVTSTWVKNEWMRYLSRMKEGKKASDSLCVIFKDFSPSSLPNSLKGKQNLKYGEITFLENLKSYVKKVVDASKQTTPILQRKEVSLAKKKGQKSIEAVKKETVTSISKKTSSLSSLEVKKRAVGEYSLPKLSANEESKLNQAEVYLSMKQFGKAQKLYEEVLLSNKENAQALLGKLLCENKTATLDEFKASRLMDLRQLHAVLEVIQYSKKEVAFPLLEGYAELTLRLAKDGEFAKLNELYPSIASYDVPAINLLHEMLLSRLKEHLDAPETFPLLKQCLTYLSGHPNAFPEGLKELMKAYRDRGDFPKAEEFLRQYEEYFDYDAETYLLGLAIKAGEKSNGEFLLSLCRKKDFSCFSGSLPLDEIEIDNLFRDLGFFAANSLAKYPKEMDALIRFLLPYSFAWRPSCIDVWVEACCESPNQEVAKVLDGVLHAFDDDSFDQFLAVQKRFSLACVKHDDFDLAKVYADRLIEYDPDNPEHYRWRIQVRTHSKNEQEFKESIHLLGQEEDYSDIEALISFRGKNPIYPIVKPYLDACIYCSCFHMKKGDLHHGEIALRVYDAISSYIPKEEDASLSLSLLSLAKSLKEIGQYEQAGKYYASLVSINPLDHQSYWNLVQCRLKVQKEEEILTCRTPLSELPEFENTKLAASNDKAALSHYIDFETRQAAYLEEEANKKKAKRRKATKKAAIISISSLLLAGAVAAGVLAFTVFIPKGNVEKATTFIKTGDYDSAIQALGNQTYGESKNLLSMAQAGKSFQGKDYESGIDKVLEAGGEVKVNYDADGKDIEKQTETIRPKRAYIENEASKPGYHIEGWEQKQFTLTVDGSYGAELWLTASSYEAIHYSISYELSGGENDEDNPSFYTVEDNVTFADPYRDGYTFLGWYDQQGRKIELIARGSMTDYVLTARWAAIKNNLSVSSGDDSRGTASLIKGEGYTDEEISVLAEPKDGYLFRDWVMNDEPISSSASYTFSMPSSDCVLTARFWTLEEKEAISYGKTPSLSPDGKTLTYGLYPQSHVSDSELIKALNGISKVEENGFVLYQDVYYASWYGDNSLSHFHDGTKMDRHTKYWFRCDPIEWNILSNVNGETLLISKYCLSSGMTYGQTPDYSESNIRRWLNGDFLSSAFAFDDSYILPTLLNNTFESFSYRFEYPATEDKAFLLTGEDYLNEAYGFADDASRKSESTDYSLCRGAYQDPDHYDNFGSWYWTRTPSSHSYTDGPMVTIGYKGQVNSDYPKYAGLGIRPAIVISYGDSSPIDSAKVTLPLTNQLKLIYGLYPQSHVNDASVIASLNAVSKPEENGWYLLNGKYYAKQVAKPDDPEYHEYRYDDGTAIVQDSLDWFLCEPIEWKILRKMDGEALVVSDLLLDVHRWNEIDSESTDDVRYEGTEIRQWLNDEFLSSAFSLGSSSILTTMVDNSAASTGDGNNPYFCANTEDKIFLLSRKEYESYFSFSDVDSLRCSVTDWAKARGASLLDSQTSPNSGNYWTRSPHDGGEKAWYVNAGHNSVLLTGGVLDQTGLCVRPAMKISLP